MQSRIQMDAKPGSPLAAALLEHALMAGRARALSAGGVDVHRGLVQEAASLQPNAPRTRAAGALYAAAVAAMRLRDLREAGAFTERLAALLQDDRDAARHVAMLRSELALASGRADRAAALVDGRSQQRAEVILWSQASLAAGDNAAVVQRLEQWVIAQPRDAHAWQVAQLDYSAAVDRYKAAQQVSRRGGGSRADYIEATIVDTRLRQVESLLREQALER